jgi:hypothetical protein
MHWSNDHDELEVSAAGHPAGHPVPPKKNSHRGGAVTCRVWLGMVLRMFTKTIDKRVTVKSQEEPFTTRNCPEGDFNTFCWKASVFCT